MGWIRLSYVVQEVRCTNVFLTYDIFKLQWVYWDITPLLSLAAAILLVEADIHTLSQFQGKTKTLTLNRKGLAKSHSKKCMRDRGYCCSYLWKTQPITNIYYGLGTTLGAKYTLEYKIKTPVSMVLTFEGEKTDQQNDR